MIIVCIYRITIIWEIFHRAENWSSILISLLKEWLQILGPKVWIDTGMCSVSTAQLNEMNVRSLILHSSTKHLLSSYYTQAIGLDTGYIVTNASKGHSGMSNTSPTDQIFKQLKTVIMFSDSSFLHNKQTYSLYFFLQNISKCL